MTIDDLRAVLRADARDVAAADAVLDRVAARLDAPRRRRTILAVAATVVAMLVAGVLVYVLRDRGTDEPTARPTGWRTYTLTTGVTVRYPASWYVREGNFVGSFTSSLGLFGTERPREPCRTTGSETECHGLVFAFPKLDQGGVALMWTSTTVPAMKPRTAKARATDADTDCRGQGGQTSVTASFAEDDQGQAYEIDMIACVAAPRDSTQVAQVLASARSLRVH